MAIDSPIFIIGVGRSGTTLIQSMLNAHSKIAFPTETHFVRYYLADKKRHQILFKDQIEDLFTIIKQDKDLQRLNFDLEELFSTNRNSIQTLTDFYDLILKTYLDLQNKAIIGDKDPKNLEFLHIIKKIYPQAKILHIIRDPRDVIISRLKADWTKNKNVIYHSLIYSIQYQKAKKDGIRLFGDNYFDFHYEDLITEPENQLQEICHFLNINYEPSMLNYYKNASDIIKGDEVKWKEKCFKPVDKTNLNKWKQKLSKENVFNIQEITKPVFCTNKYDIQSVAQIPFFHKIKVLLIKLCFPFINGLYDVFYKNKYLKIRKYL